MTPKEHAELLTIIDQFRLDTISQARAWLRNNPPTEPEPTKAEPDVPLRELQDLLGNMEDTGHRTVTREDCVRWLGDVIAEYTPKPALPPNPHPTGTYLWAREEHLRGRTVQLGIFQVYPDRREWDRREWAHCHFTATTWKAVE